MERIISNDKQMVKFCIDKTIKNKAYPNLATVKAAPYTKKWREFSTTTPFSEPVMLFEYMTEANIDYNYVSIDEADNDTFYPIALSYFDFDIKWFALMPDNLVAKLKNKTIKILFYYSEGDNPYVIDKHISQQCVNFDIPREQIVFISANSEAANIDNFHYVVDDELLFHFRNEKNPNILYSEHKRAKKYTALVRMHKYWRANIMSTLWQQQLDTDGYFAYGNEINAGETEADNPIEVDKFFGLRQRTRIFLSCTPFIADRLDSTQHNDHTICVHEHFSDSYINIILESHMDVDQSGGVFLTEKTFKPIKNAQLFVIFGACGSLQKLRDIGYKTFDHVLDNSYDKIENTTDRWNAGMEMIIKVLNRRSDDIHAMYIKSQADLIHNQTLFNTISKERVNNLINTLYNL